ncbi:hypothetical protein [Clostridium saccharobutylicum]|uniref:Uncharacterized protein n=1 Tax=Clostridium saccharobutylicum DSM 13864 TaxID=1345695 RepID=U5MPV2_CLOSA|nr:hypothetical protein [Clostridium saccharobutylicum]AGX42839.1 hypothetical protein CLSA_c18460 [Clostridium saccharobutylicum DSM 13864]MBA2904564.1 hypothetical protein [Clostridium saccharobutylicum]MBA8789145.1 hypothetical protein [Clostridium saccharobutylicum]MBA8895832.1 hypothetical protein [Clostridium saccharobutylicum]MBA8980972.1 hypothetical protein [Clostridium saccharobutylicum]
MKQIGRIIKVNIYAETKRKNNNKLKLKNIEKIISEYNVWLEETNREDKIENYEEFLRVK